MTLSKEKISSIKKRLACRIPIVSQVVERLYNPDSSVLHCLAMPNTALANTVLGSEKVVFQDAHTVISTNNYFIRYLCIATDDLHPTGKKISQFQGNKEFAVGVLVLKLNHQNRHVIDNIYIDVAYRRQGIASRLLERAFSDFPDLCLDGRFTTEGISFFGAKHRKK
ncbi:GNAT family N-acetyltransferase [Undibacterium sp. CY21W]|uniref:GNAT family N-acetyltransferase n=1 Tax=Undibacterium sp. CY21W TaxID=2762293 RepID=UPI00164BBAAC|nr:GNAT family N-acetyltransferase [Undibacterium sp. CY21W]MBC3928988.1 GNAT family N-acetyltransferase [Undibacterium sp. CY21W]